MTDATRSALLLQLSEAATAADNTLPDVAAVRQMFARLEMNHVAELFRVLEFTLLLRFDLSILFADYVENEHRPQAHVYARFLILTIYEGARTYRHLLGKQLQAELASSDDSKELIPHIRRVHKALNTIASEAEQVYGDVRNGIAAHRDADAIVQLRRLRDIGGEELADFVLRFLQAAGELEVLLAAVTAGIAQSVKNHIRVVSLRPGTQTNINVTVSGSMPGEARQINAEEIEWVSSDPTVAEVNISGYVTAHCSGHSRITFRSNVSPEVNGGLFVFVGDDDQLAEMSRAWNALITGVE